MTRQQINLYQDSLIEKPESFQSRQALALLGILCVLLAVVYGVNRWQGTKLAEEVIRLERQNKQLVAEVATLQQLYPEKHKSVLLEEKLLRAKEQIREREDILKYFRELDDVQSNRIIQVLDGLARNPLNNIWLDSITLHGKGEHIQLTGRALSSEVVPDYLKMLADQEVFSGKLFSRFKLEQMAEEDDVVQFVLESRQD